MRISPQTIIAGQLGVFRLISKIVDKIIRRK
jgi:hypothetical protein